MPRGASDEGRSGEDPEAGELLGVGRGGLGGLRLAGDEHSLGGVTACITATGYGSGKNTQDPPCD